MKYRQVTLDDFIDVRQGWVVSGNKFDITYLVLFILFEKKRYTFVKNWKNLLTQNVQ